MYRVRIFHKQETKIKIIAYLNIFSHLLREFNNYMLTKARKFTRENGLILKEDVIEDTINRCRNTVFENNKKPLNSSNNFKVIVKSDIKEDTVVDKTPIKNNVTESMPKKLRHPNQNAHEINQPNTSICDTEVKKLSNITLKPDCFQKVLISHVESKDSCYVTPLDNIEHKKSLTTDVDRFAKTGKKTELYKNLIYACNYDEAW